MSKRFAPLMGALAIAIAACGGGSPSAATGSGGGGTASGEIQVWAHQGQENEVQATQKAIDDFNASQSAIKATITFIPEGDYATTLGTTNADAFPDVLDIDGPSMASLVYATKIQSVTGLVSQATLDNQIASVNAQNTARDGKQYMVSQFDSGLALYGNKSMLDAAGVAYPTKAADAWTVDEFEAALDTLAADDDDGKVLDIKENYGGTWPGYAFLPIINSTGNHAVKANKATGNLNAPAVVDALARFAGWKQYVDPNGDDLAFANKRVALSWVGHWVYTQYSTALEDDLVLIPLPDFGQGSKSGQGSFGWGIGAKSDNPAAAGVFLDFLMGDGPVKSMTDANGAPPGTTTVTAVSDLYKPSGPLQLYADQLAATCGAGDVELTPACVTVPRTVTPAWPVINEQLSKAWLDAYAGSDPKAALDAAAAAIDQDFADNAGYGLE